jgi:hypothetical protein
MNTVIRQDVEVLLDSGPDPRALHLHRHLGAGTVGAAQPGLV